MADASLERKCAFAPNEFVRDERRIAPVVPPVFPRRTGSSHSAIRGLSPTPQRSLYSVPPFGPLSSNPQPTVLPRFGAKNAPVVDVTNEFAHALPPPRVVGLMMRHVGFE